MTEQDVAPHPGGRPTRLTPEVTQRIVDAVRAGATVHAAAAYAGVAERTLYYWQERAADDDAPDELREFGEGLRRARAELQVRTVALVMRKIAGGVETTKTRRTLPDGTVETTEVERHLLPDGRLGLDFLSRVFPADFGRREALEVSGPEGKPVELAIPADRLLELAERVHAALDDISSPVVDADIADDTTTSP